MSAASGGLRESLRKTRQALGAEIQATLFDEAQRRDLGAARGGADLRRRWRPNDREVVRQLEREATEGGITGGEALTARLTELLAEIATDRRRPDRPAGQADGDPDGRRQRHRQDDDGRQARPPSQPGVRPLGRACRRRHVPCCRGRAARDLGGARRRDVRPRARPAPTRGQSRSRGSRRRSATAPTS